jgi:hypothetical protein
MIVLLTCMCAARPSMTSLEPLARQVNASECKRRQAPRQSAKSHELPATRHSGPVHSLIVFPPALSLSLSFFPTHKRRSLNNCGAHQPTIEPPFWCTKPWSLK